MFLLPCEIVEAVHDDSDDDVEHNEWAEEDEGDKVEVGHGGAAGTVGVDQLAGRLVVLQGQLVTGPSRNASHHDVRPSFSSWAAEEHEESAESYQVWSLTQSYSVIFSKSWIIDGARNFSLDTITVYVNCSQL